MKAKRSVPTLEEIAAEAAKIRETWTEEERRRRAATNAPVAAQFPDFRTTRCGRVGRWRFQQFN